MRCRGVFILFFFLFGISVAGFAQNSADQLKSIRSGVVEKIDGREYYIHTIKRGQTLYMISKAYGVQVNDLIAENPGVKNGIRADEKLRIPVPGKGGDQKTKSSPTPEAKPVQPGKSPEKAGGAGSKSSVREAGSDAKSSVKEGGAGEKTVATNVADTLVEQEIPCGMDGTTRSRIYNVALMMPLYLQDVDKDPGAPLPVEPYRPFQFIQFYEGFLMAVDSLVKTGLRIKLTVYDVGKDTSKTRQLLRKPEFKKCDLIVGVLYVQNFKIVAEFARKNKINLVNPISERSDILVNNPYVFKMRPSKKSRMDDLAAYMTTAFYRGDILILRGGQFAGKELPKQLKKECLERKLQIVHVENQENLILKLSKEKENYVVVFADNAAYIIELTRRLFELRNDYTLSLVGLPDWLSLEGLDMEYLVGLHAHMMAPLFVDYGSPEVKKFVGNFASVYKTDPESLAFQGFDTGIYFLSALRNFGPDLQRCIGDFKMKTLQTSFEFNRSSPKNGFENHHWNIFKYENYKLIGVN